MIGSSIVSSTEDGFDKLAKHARSVLILLAALQFVGSMISYIAGAIDPIALASALGLGIVFAALAMWALKNPLTAVLVGLGIWVTVNLVEAYIEPSSLFNGLLVKVLVIVLFINGVSTGLTYNKMKQTLAKKS